MLLTGENQVRKKDIYKKTGYNSVTDIDGNYIGSLIFPGDTVYVVAQKK